MSAAHAEWRVYRAALRCFDAAPGDATAASLLDAWEPWWDAFIGPNDPAKPRCRAALQAGIAARLADREAA